MLEVSVATIISAPSNERRNRVTVRSDRSGMSTDCDATIPAILLHLVNDLCFGQACAIFLLLHHRLGGLRSNRASPLLGKWGCEVIVDPLLFSRFPRLPWSRLRFVATSGFFSLVCCLTHGLFPRSIPIKKGSPPSSFDTHLSFGCIREIDARERGRQTYHF